MFNLFKSSDARRREPEFRLEAKLRSAANTQRRRAGLRLLPWLGLAALLAAGTLALLGIARHQWLYRVPAFALTTIEVRREVGALSEAEILATAGIRRGMNTLALDLPSIQARLHRHPRVERAELRRELPGTLRLVIHERFPVARVRPSNSTTNNAAFQLDGYYLLDDTGFTLMPFRPGQASQETLEAEAALPVVVGAVTTDFVPGRPITHENTLSALRLLSAFEGSTMVGVTDILTVDVSQPGDLVVVTSTGSRITFGRRDFDPTFSVQLRRWQAVHQDSLRQNRIIGSLDVSVLNNAPLRWLEEGQVPPPAPTHPKPKRVKPPRRHV